MSAEQTRPSLAHGIDIIRKRWPEVVSGSTEMPIFICAAGWRSGSTFLQRLITPSCFLWGEPYGQSWMIDALSDPLRRFSRNWPEPHFFYRGQHADTLSGTFIANLYPSPKDLMEAHHAFFDRLFIQPVRKNGYVRWGLKEVRLSADHACYLKWLFPLAKFLFLYRNPYDCYRSYAARRNSGWKWFNRFPDQPLNVQNFGRHWRTLVTSFLEGHSQVDGLLVQYEDMAKGDFGPIEEYLGLKLSADAAEVNPSDGGPPPVESIPETELIELKREVGELAEKMGYSAPQSSQTEISASESSAVPPRSQCVVLVSPNLDNGELVNPKRYAMTF